MGQISQHPVQILVDGGSTHNFVQARMVSVLGLKCSPTSVLKVLVGSGEELRCTQVCCGVHLMIQGHEFLVDLYALGMTGSDVVLGAQWLKQLGPVLMDYHNLTMKFVHGPNYVETKGGTSSSPTTISLHQLHKIIKEDHGAQFFSIRVSGPDDPTPHLLNHENPKVQRLLHDYATLFEEPSHLPPPRFSDHAIPLFSNATPVNVRPYRYPHAHKIEIESQVSKLLENGWIQSSNQVTVRSLPRSCSSRKRTAHGACVLITVP